MKKATYALVIFSLLFSCTPSTNKEQAAETSTAEEKENIDKARIASSTVLNPNLASGDEMAALGLSDVQIKEIISGRPYLDPMVYLEKLNGVVGDEKMDDIIELLPGMKSPTVLPLAQEGWSSVHSVIKEDDFWEVIDQLKEKGAEGILVCPIEKMIV